MSFIFHSPGFKIKDPDCIFNKISSKLRKVDVNRNLTIITWNSKDSKGLLERCLDVYGYPYIVLGRGIKKWNNFMKIKLNVDAIKDISTDYVMGLDSRDVIVLDDPAKAIKCLDEYDCKMLFGAEKQFWPYCVKGCESNACSFCRWRKKEDSISVNEYRYLNSGMWIGKTNFCREFFNIGSNKRSNKLKLPSNILRLKSGRLQKVRFNTDDQFLHHWLFVELYPEVKIDCFCRCFKNTNNKLGQLRFEGAFYYKTFI